MIFPPKDERLRRFVKGMIILICLGVSEVATSGFLFQKVGDTAKKLEMIQC